MLRSLRNMQEFKVQGKDGEIGSVHGFLFKDDSWRIAYIVVDAGKLLSGHKAIIPPAALESCDQVKKKLSVSLRKKQVKNGPDIDSDKPVSRQKEIELNRYYGWPMPGIALPAADMPSVHGLVPAPESREGRPSSVDNDTNLRSTREIIGYRIEASNGTVGEVEGFLVDDESWTIRYVIVSLGKPLHGKQVLVAPEWIDKVSWQEEKVYVNLLKDTVRNCPEYDPYAQVTREYESLLYEHYGRPKYWDKTNQ